MALSKSQRVANDKYIQKNYDRLPLSYPKDFCSTFVRPRQKQGRALQDMSKKQSNTACSATA